MLCAIGAFPSHWFLSPFIFSIGVSSYSFIVNEYSWHFDIMVINAELNLVLSGKHTVPSQNMFHELELRLLVVICVKCCVNALFRDHNAWLPSPALRDRLS